ncbi:MAG: MotA/TolQ/ExbB proton channel family protein [Candidatus Firestonebacteria bacterium]
MPENMSLLQAIGRNVWALLTIAVLIVCSFLSVYFMIERFLRYKKAKIDTTHLLGKIRRILIKNGKFNKTNIPQALDLCKETRGPVAVTLMAGLVKFSCPKEEIEDNMQKTALEEVSKLEQNLVVIGSIGSVAPFIGLLGTVIGVTESFMRLSSMGGGGINVVGAGIAQALVATIIGLFVAIPAVVGYNILIRMVNNFSTEMTTSSVELISIITTKSIGKEDLEETKE